MLILSIDIGIKNLGFSVINLNKITCNILCIKESVPILSYKILDDIYIKYKFYYIDHIIIEQQIKGNKNIYYYGFIRSYFESKKKKMMMRF